ncbi:hypothetical protein EJB05_55462 [Eragrostis curvula]|uniref:DUF4283 domain-containing protein n=1 Tax=Eragrostis curvula TaxID=38414 RepID=A0A5J9SJR3_9POAL|nr:hypothetical protein EJB05_55462 [Eragrostis curvula]
MPRQRSKKQGRRRRSKGSKSSSSSRALGDGSSSSSGVPMAPDHSRRPLYGATRYWSPWCPLLRTKAWLAFDGLPPHLWTKRTCEFAVSPFGGLVRFDAPPSDVDGGRVVVEARITRPEDVPLRIEAQHHVGFGHLLVWPFDVEILAYAPVGDGDVTYKPGGLIMMVGGPRDNCFVVDDDDDEDIQVGKPKRMTFPAPKPEECVGILDAAGEAIERPALSTCQAFSDD